MGGQKTRDSLRQGLRSSFEEMPIFAKKPLPVACVALLFFGRRGIFLCFFFEAFFERTSEAF